MATRTATTYARPQFSRARENAYAYAYILPGFLFIGLATLVGTAYSLYISFTNYDGLTHFDQFDWVGLENYREVLFGVDIGTFWMVTQWTLVFALLSTLLSFVVGLALALLLNDQRLPERSLYRTLLIIPWALPATITILAWSGIFNDDFGYLNQFLNAIGLGDVPWLSDAFWAKVSVLILNTWLAFPFMMTACLGALQSIPDELNEAAVVDGAGVALAVPLRDDPAPSLRDHAAADRHLRLPVQQLQRHLPADGGQPGGPELRRGRHRHPRLVHLQADARPAAVRRRRRLHRDHLPDHRDDQRGADEDVALVRGSRNDERRRPTSIGSAGAPETVACSGSGRGAS